MGFVRVPGNIEPEGAQAHWLEGRGGVKLRALSAPALATPARGTVIICNGRTEFIEKYFEVIGELQNRGFAVVTMDWRGQGLSDRSLPNRLKGHLENLEDPAMDLQSMIAALADKAPRPHIILAHSMGGGIALRALQSRRVEVDGAFFCAPMWGIASLKEFARRYARFMTSIGAGGWFAPGVETKWRKEGFKRNPVTHDPDRHARGQALVATEPQLQLAGPTLSWVMAAAEAFDGFRTPGALAHLRIPICVASAAEEVLVDNSSHEAVAKLLPNARHIVIPGAKHEILMETDAIRAQLWKAFDALADQVAPSGATRPVSV